MIISSSAPTTIHPSGIFIPSDPTYTNALPGTAQNSVKFPSDIVIVVTSKMKMTSKMKAMLEMKTTSNMKMTFKNKKPKK